jgi:hypothetical protein
MRTVSRKGNHDGNHCRRSLGSTKEGIAKYRNQSVKKTITKHIMEGNDNSIKASMPVTTSNEDANA